MENNKQCLCIISDDTIKGLITKANNLSIQHKDMVDIMKINEYFTLIYYTNE